VKLSRAHRLIDATSQWFNVLLFDGEANHSISGDAYRFGRVRLEQAIDGVFVRLPFGLAESDHCRKSHEADVARAESLVAEARTFVKI